MSHLSKINPPLFFQKKITSKLKRKSTRALKVSGKLLDYENENRRIDDKFGNKSKIIKLLSEGLPHPDDKAKGYINFIAPSRFSLTLYPEETLAAISNLANQLRINRVTKVRIDFSKVTIYDVGANALLNILIKEISIQSRKDGYKINWDGLYPQDVDLKRFIKGMGAIKNLKVSHEYLPKEESAKLETFEDRCRNYAYGIKASEADKKAKVSQAFSDYINKCLAHINKKLTQNARHKICAYVGEIIDNAEEHSGMHEWSIQGYLDTHPSEWKCEIVIFNFGATFPQTFQRLSKDHYAREKINPYLEAHGKRRLFQKGWRQEDLITLISLQGGISSKNNNDSDTRGNGTVDLIEFFQEIHRACNSENNQNPAIMSLISGSTKILFDGTYTMAKNAGGNGVIAFNPTNDLMERPDSAFVKQIEGVEFPGTVLSIKFNLPASRTINVSGEA